jgi:LacI family transcriptional regulator
LLSLSHPPTAILASNDEMALASLHVAARLGFRVPDDVSIVSFDDTPGVRLSVPGLTSIRQPISDMAAKAAELLIGVSRTGETTSSDHLLPFGLEVRGSTAPPR